MGWWVGGRARACLPPSPALAATWQAESRSARRSRDGCSDRRWARPMQPAPPHGLLMSTAHVITAALVSPSTSPAEVGRSLGSRGGSLNASGSLPRPECPRGSRSPVQRAAASSAMAASPSAGAPAAGRAHAAQSAAAGARLCAGAPAAPSPFAARAAAKTVGADSLPSSGAGSSPFAAANCQAGESPFAVALGGASSPGVATPAADDASPFAAAASLATAASDATAALFDAVQAAPLRASSLRPAHLPSALPAGQASTAEQAAAAVAASGGGSFDAMADSVLASIARMEGAQHALSAAGAASGTGGSADA